MAVREILIEIIKREVPRDQQNNYTGPSVTLVELAEKVNEITKNLRREIDNLS